VPVLVVIVLVSVVFAEIPEKRRIAELIRHDQLPAAEQQLWGVLGTHPDEVWALELMGELRARQKRNAEAVALFHRVLELDPSGLEAQRRLGALYQSEGNAAEAARAQEAIQQSVPGDRDANLALATLYEQTGKYQESVAAVERIPVSSLFMKLKPVQQETTPVPMCSCICFAWRTITNRMWSI